MKVAITIKYNKLSIVTNSIEQSDFDQIELVISYRNKLKADSEA